MERVKELRLIEGEDEIFKLKALIICEKEKRRHSSWKSRRGRGRKSYIQKAFLDVVRKRWSAESDSYNGALSDNKM